LKAQGLRVIIVVVQVGAVKIYVAAVEALMKRKDRMKLSLLPKLVEKLIWVPVISLCKIFIPSNGFDALLCRNWQFPRPLIVRLYG
jgi:NADH:ubiquinone oxidoreductase subunit 6 (subunit J)